MEYEAEQSQTDGRDSLQEFLSVLSRRRHVVLLVIGLTLMGAAFYSVLQDPLYEGNASVLATSGSSSGTSDFPVLAAGEEPERASATHVGLARLPAVAERVIVAAPLVEDASAFLKRSSVIAEADADILQFAVQDADAEQASRLATLYAQQFTKYRNELDIQRIRSTRAAIARAMAALVASGARESALLRDLQRAARQLDAAAALQGSAAIVVQPSIAAIQVRPRPVRNLVLAGMVGLLLGIAMAFLIERLDLRARNPEQIEALVGLPVLGELSKPPDTGKAQRSVSMLDFPGGSYAESVRKLRANLDFAMLDTSIRTLVITSVASGVGKSTAAADLAVALARSGRRIALCDLDARAPTLDRAFGVSDTRGLVDVALGLESLEQTLIPVAFGSPSTARTLTSAFVAQEGHGDGLATGTRSSGSRGSLNLLPFGRRRPPSPGDFVGSNAVREVVADLVESHDLVIIDTAPLMPVSDAIVISEYVDAALIVCSLDTHKPTLGKIRRLVSALPTRVLGLVVTGLPDVPGYGPYSRETSAQRSAYAEDPTWAA